MHNRADAIVERACHYLDRPWRHQGRDWTIGVDCIGLLICVAHDLGISQYDTRDYTTRPDIQRFDQLMRDTGCRRLGFKAMEHSDILRINEDGWPVHVGLYDARDGGWLIHSTLRAKRVLREPLGPLRNDQITAVWRFPESG